MLDVVRHLISRFRRVGDRPGDEDDLLLRKHAFTLMAAVVFVAAVLWAVLGVVSHRPLLTSASIAFAVVDAGLIVAFARSGRFGPIVNGMLGAGLLYVVAAHLALGGLASNGASLTWGLLAPVLAVLLFGRTSGLRWFGVYLVLVLLAVVCDPLIGSSMPIRAQQDLTFAAFNLLGPGAIILLLVTFVDGDRTAARREYRSIVHETVPPSIGERLRRGERPIAEEYRSATVLFADLVNFTAFAERTRPAEVILLLSDLFNAFDVLAQRFGVEKVKTIGDAYMAVAGAPVSREGHADAALRLAIAMQKEVRRRATLRSRGVALRIGIASGAVSGGVLGRHKYAWDLWGDVVNMASRMESSGMTGRIQMTAATAAELTGSYPLERRDHVTVQGKGSLSTYMLDPAVVGETPQPAVERSAPVLAAATAR